MNHNTKLSILAILGMFIIAVIVLLMGRMQTGLDNEQTMSAVTGNAYKSSQYQGYKIHGEFVSDGLSYGTSRYTRTQDRYSTQERTPEFRR